ncbi:MAG TPA: STAS domain-containing protein [Acidimicrobiales bacterium]|nr:STAS domain-containing protein [Acidimicrobiales bacterium]
MEVIDDPPTSGDQRRGQPTSFSPPEFSVRISPSDRQVVVAVSGEVDAHTGPMLQEQLNELIAAHDNLSVVVDFGSVGFIDSSGLAALVSAHKLATAKGGALSLSQPSRQVRKVLEITGLDRVVHVTDAS